MKPRTLGRITLAVAGLLLLALAGWIWSEDQPVISSTAQRFRIFAGESLTQTATKLAEARLVRNPVLFRWYVQLTLGGSSVPSGTFAIPGGMSAHELAEYLRHAQPLDVKVTIPEGWTSTKIARLLQEKDVVSAQSFLEVVRDPPQIGPAGIGLGTLEGRLYPDTYRFPVNSSAVDIVSMMVGNFRDKTSSWASKTPASDFNNAIILASIVEREYRDPLEAPLVASVFTNRLRKGIALGSCATIEYILTEVLGRPHPRRIFFIHTEIPSPFNTYRNKGLPPAAISNPGLTSLRAVFEPQTTDYLYFVIDDPQKGTHTFSSLYSEHEKARAQYLSSYVTKG